jgi:ribosomal protein L7/L12
VTTSNYFQSYQNYFWQWEDAGDVIAIPQESTIAYRQLLGDIIDKLYPQGLPPFGSLLLAMIATNPNGSASLDTIYSIVQQSGALPKNSEATLAGAIGFLKLLTELPKPYKEGKHRILLLQVLFERCHYILSLKASAGVQAQYNQRLFENGLEPVPLQDSIFDKDFRPLSILAGKFQSTQDIINRIAALPDTQQYEIKFDETPGNDSPVTKTDFIDELLQSYKTFSVGSLIRWLWSGLNIPVHSALPSQQPLGGFSDLTNKGDFDKLLVSEFAYDDLLFLSRLANNEALYIHREVPPTQNNLQRLILIDATMKNWGNPKAIAFAIAIAIARHPKTDIDCSVVVLGNISYHTVSIETIDSVIDAVQIVEEGLHPARSLEAFFKDNKVDSNKEVFFITEPSTLKQSALLKVLNEHQHRIHYHVYTDIVGNVDIYKRQGSSKRHLQHILLPLKTLWQRPASVKKEVPQLANVHVNYPILVREDTTVKVRSAPDQDIFLFTNERSILRLFDKTTERHQRGWDVLYRGLPFHPDHCEIGMDANRHHVALIFNANTRELILLNLHTFEKKTSVFQDWKSTAELAFIFDDGVFFHHNFSGTWSISTGGNIQRIDSIDTGKFRQRQELLQSLPSKYILPHSLLKNVTKVFINNGGELVFKLHTLKLVGSNMHIKFMQCRDHSIKMSAQLDYNLFVFEDGSSVEVDRSGLLILCSSDTQIPTIYIPTALDSSLGVATQHEFAGNDYYYKEPVYEVTLKRIGDRKLETVKTLKDQGNFSLQEAKTMVDNGNAVVIFTNCLKEKAQAFQKTMTEIGNDVELRVLDGSAEMKKIPLTEFNKKYIERYINTILNYGVKAHTK